MNHHPEALNVHLDPNTPTLITCTPGASYFSVRDLEYHYITQLSDPERAITQHNTLAQLIEQAGTKVINLPELPGHPNSIFTKDTAVCTSQGFIKIRMGLPSRRGEEKWMANQLTHLGIQRIGQIDAPGTVEGGDVILANPVAFIGHSSRTNQSGIEQLDSLIREQGYEIRIAKVPAPFLHIGGIMSLISQDTILTIEGLFPEKFFKGFHLIKVPGTGFISGNVIPLSNRQIIAEQSNIHTIRLLRKNGFTVFPLGLSEFVKGTGGPSCLIMQVK